MFFPGTDNIEGGNKALPQALLVYEKVIVTSRIIYKKKYKPPKDTLTFTAHSYFLSKRLFAVSRSCASPAGLLVHNVSSGVKTNTPDFPSAASDFTHSHSRPGFDRYAVIKADTDTDYY